MGKGDPKRSRNKVDEQQTISQGYLTGLQQQLANQNAGFNNLYWGGGQQPQVGGTFGYGSTVPHFSWTGSPYFSGNGTDTPTPIMSAYGGGGGGQAYTAADVKAKLMPLLQGSGPASSDTLERLLPTIQQMFPGTTRDNSSGPLDEIVVPGVGIIDLITGAEGSGPKNWSFQTGPGGGGGYGAMGGGGIPGMNIADYQNIMGMYGNLFGDMRGKWGNFLGSASSMANTGGLTEGDKANLRARAISPIRAAYGNATRNLDRSRALQGGYSPGYATALTRMNRDMGQGVSDATTNAEASIAEMVQRGKLGGLSAWGSGLGGMTSGLGGLLGGMSGLYGTQPGLSSTFGNQALQSMAQQLTMGGLQNQLGLGLINGLNDAGQVKGTDWGTIIKGVGTAAAMAAMASNSAFKENIHKIEDDEIIEKFANLPIYEWSYIGSPKRHVGPMAEEFKEIFGYGDGIVITAADVLGLTLALGKAIALKNMEAK